MTIKHSTITGRELAELIERVIEVAEAFNIFFCLFPDEEDFVQSSQLLLLPLSRYLTDVASKLHESSVDGELILMGKLSSRT
ncbi:hypothetical protein [Photorhabdus stackebrandtii]|uniref:Uncharacterized protein n=1 Tax=Photorhabdus stackebrandtii TaxID=1123042 RepID=A0A7X5QQZ9_9GAMM|nr:hypothetical protein [Photorhabdus stackebrandtii]NHB98744.1 hypothetical protein [Photorhabdus stackebrandtii]